MNKFLKRCEELLKLSNCVLIHFGAVLVKNGRIIGEGYNLSLVACNSCLKDKIKDRGIGYNPGICYAVHAEWMALVDAINKVGMDRVNDSSLYIVGRYPNGELWKSNYFACTICSRLLYYCGVKEIVGTQFEEKVKLSMKEAFDNSYKHLLGKYLG